MDLGLREKTVLVTGSTAGIGFAAARRFAEEGANVVVNGRVQFKDGKLDVQRGAGRYLPRKLDKGFPVPVKAQ